ncbi:MAG: hypothetical protein P8P55_01100 [Flavobacteriaceae bacterium]|jgi:hypothetical protein|nr:hypothetical protein [Flavobacteriaceae bacterium]|tara:strand:- start:53 stop:229 length:177 start_codon:yes stop_codon:yes gene_type:complete
MKKIYNAKVRKYLGKRRKEEREKKKDLKPSTEREKTVEQSAYTKDKISPIHENSALYI